MSEHHSHEHHDHSSHAHIPQDKKILALSFAIITGFMVVEFVGGYWFNSLALMADAGHMANDSLSLFLALLALFLSAQKQRYIALLNSGSLIVVALMILFEAIQRWQNDGTTNAWRGISRIIGESSRGEDHVEQRS